ncbi:LysR family transcriptional regulator [Bordetella genomosp. 11]|nr:LysR family transcriptional regulator [Bordetella genomosp. 11]
MYLSPTDLDYFLAVVRHGHFGRAALEQGVTQPAITKALRRLENTVGVALFERGAHGARLTSEGHIFHEHARRVSLQHAELAKLAADLRANHSGLLRIGLTNPAGDSNTVRALAELIRNRPGLRIKLTIGKSDSLNAAVEAGDLDMAVVPCPLGTTFSCEQETLGQDAVVVAARAGHPIFRATPISLAATGAYAWVMPSRDSGARKAVAQLFEAAGLAEPTVALEAEYVSETALGMVAATDLLAVAPLLNLRSWAAMVMTVPLPGFPLTRRLVLLSRRGGHYSALMASLRDQLLLAYKAPA